MNLNERDTKLMLAIQAKDIVALQRALTDNADPDAADAYGRTALHLATLDGEIGLMAILISRGADVNKTDLSGFGPLHAAMEKKQLSAAELLLDKQADINLQDGAKRMTPLHVAVNVDMEDKRIDRVAFLLKKGADETRKNAYGQNAAQAVDEYSKRFPFAGEIATYIEEFAKGRDLRAKETAVAAEKARLKAFNDVAHGGLQRDVSVRRITVKPRAPAQR